MLFVVLLALTFRPAFDNWNRSSGTPGEVSELTGGLAEVSAQKDITAPAVIAPAANAPAAIALWPGWSNDDPPPAVAPFDTNEAVKHQEKWAHFLNIPVVYENTVGMKFCLIPPGEFAIGSSKEDIDHALRPFTEMPLINDVAWIKSEGPQHNVVITKPFYLGMFEVTQRDYMAIMNVNPSYFSASGEGKAFIEGLDTTNHPVEQVNWLDAADFCNRLSAMEERSPSYVQFENTTRSQKGTGYRLPTEGEWEFACRAGTTTKLWIGDYGARSRCRL